MADLTSAPTSSSWPRVVSSLRSGSLATRRPKRRRPPVVTETLSTASDSTGHREPMSTTNDDVEIGRWIDARFRYAVLEEAAGILMQRRNAPAQEAAAYLRGTADALGVDVYGLALLVVDSTRH